MSEQLIQEKPFVRMKLDEEKAQEKGKNMAIWFNDSELELLERAGVVLHQEKQATIIKQLLELGANVLFSEKSMLVRDLVFNNVRKNKRLGIEEINPKFRKSN